MASPFLADAHDFLLEHLMEVSAVPLRARRYRYRHCLRVAAIGRRVAEAEGLNADLLELACLLHDVGKFDAARPVDHGRAGARLARDFLRSLSMDEAEVEEVCQGIAMHTDGLFNDPPSSPDFTGVEAFTREPSLLARCVGDCDNVDRYGAHRIYDTLRWWDFDALTLPEQLERIDSYLAKLESERAYECATPTCQRLWHAALDAHTSHFTRLRGEVAAAEGYRAAWEELVGEGAEARVAPEAGAAEAGALGAREQEPSAQKASPREARADQAGEPTDHEASVWI